MASAALTHDNLISAYPGAVSAECDGHGFINVQFADDKAPLRSSGCPVCQRDQMWQQIGGFLPQRFRPGIELPAEVKEWADRGRSAEGLYISGPVGTGKTHAAWGAVARWCMKTRIAPTRGGYSEMAGMRFGPSVLFTRMTDLLDSLRPGDDSALRVSDCQGAKLLALDDLGAEKASEWTQERIYSIVDHRYANCMPLIITSNLPAGDLAPQIGERAASRLAEMCGVVVAMTGEDRRWKS